MSAKEVAETAALAAPAADAEEESSIYSSSPPFKFLPPTPPQALYPSSTGTSTRRGNSRRGAGARESTKGSSIRVVNDTSTSGSAMYDDTVNISTGEEQEGQAKEKKNEDDMSYRRVENKHLGGHWELFSEERPDDRSGDSSGDRYGKRSAPRSLPYDVDGSSRRSAMSAGGGAGGMRKDTEGRLSRGTVGVGMDHDGGEQSREGGGGRGDEGDEGRGNGRVAQIAEGECACALCV